MRSFILRSIGRNGSARVGFVTSSSFTGRFLSHTPNGSSFLSLQPRQMRYNPSIRRSSNFAPTVFSAAQTAQTPAVPSDDDDPDSDEITCIDTDREERIRRFNALDIAENKGIPVPGDAITVDVPFAPGKSMRFETGRVSRQAAGSVIARVGDTMVFVTCCSEKNIRPEADFFPLRVDYAEKFSSVGRTPGSYIKREGRPSEREILISRLIDRPLRPVFPDGYFKEVQVICNVFSYDGVHPADSIAICGSAASLHVSSLPLKEPVAGVRVSYVNGEFIVEPTPEEQKNSTATIVVAGTRTGILMIEGEADFLPEEDIIRGVRIAHESIIKLCDGMDELREKAGKEKELDGRRIVPQELTDKIEFLMSGIDEALAITSKQGRDIAVRSIKSRVISELSPSRQDELDDPDGARIASSILALAWNKCVTRRVQRTVLDSGLRVDGRDFTTVRPITIDQGVLPCAHGSSLFTRGETQTLAVATLGGEDMAKKMETLEGDEAARFYLQYSFPPSSVGEVGRVGAPGRREIGHGKLAERALMKSIPTREEFPYIIRVESNTLESNGSSSMASVCGGTLALLEAGVPLKRHVAGVAMGLIIDVEAENDPVSGEKPAVILTDILGLEDALGSCDAKFAGDETGISALQLDVKLRELSINRLKAIMMQAKEGRKHVLGKMRAVMPAANPSLPKSVPLVKSMVIPSRKIGDVIGPGGKNIKNIIEKCGGEDVLKVNIENDGTVSFASCDANSIEKAMGMIKGMTDGMEIGKKLTGKVTKILPFGLHVQVEGGKEGWMHISELENKRTEKIEDVCKIGDVMEVQVIEVDRKGTFKVSRRARLPKASGNRRGGSNAGARKATADGQQPPKKIPLK